MEISEKYTPVYIKSLITKVDKDLNCNVVEFLGDEHKVYNLNCYYDCKNPDEFLNYLLSIIFQSVPYELSKAITGKYVLKIRNHFCCNIEVQKRHIYFTNEMSTSKIDITYGSTRSTFTMLKEICSLGRRTMLSERIKRIEIPRFDIEDVCLRQKGYHAKLGVHMHDTLEITVDDRETGYNAEVLYNCETKKFKFNCYLHHEGEHYSDGDEPYTYADIVSEIESLENLKLNYEVLVKFWDSYKIED
jgi:hypothetical protein